jgi:hypothetical protein
MDRVQNIAFYIQLRLNHLRGKHVPVRPLFAICTAFDKDHVKWTVSITNLLKTAKVARISAKKDLVVRCFDNP